MTTDGFSDLMVAGSSSPFVAFFENDSGNGFLNKDILTVNGAARRIGITDFDGDGDNDISILSTAAGELSIFLNADTRRLDPPRAPTRVTAADVPRDLGRSIQVTWHSPELDEQIGRTTEYTLFRSRSDAGPFLEIGRVPAGSRRFVDVAATLADTFFYYVTAGNAAVTSPNSDIAAAVSQPAPFFELELVDEPRLSVGDTLRVRAFISAAQNAVAGISLYLTFDDSALTLIDADTSTTALVPFRVDSAIRGEANEIENRLHPGSSSRIDISLTSLSVAAGAQPVALGEIWFRTIKDRSTAITIDDEVALNRRSAVVETGTGNFVLPFISELPTQVAVRDFPVRGAVSLEGRTSPSLAQQVTLTLVDAEGVTLASSRNDEDRFLPGIQYTLKEDGSFSLAQIPAGQYRVFLKAPTHLQGQVATDTVTVGGPGSKDITFHWLRSDSTVVDTLGAGDATNDNRVNLADYGVLVRHFGATAADQLTWPRARAADFNGNEVVEIGDFFLLAQNFGEIGQEIAAVAGKRSPLHAGSVYYAEESGALVGSGLGSIIGLAFSAELVGEREQIVPTAVETSMRSTVFSGLDLVIHQWTDGATWHLVAALRHPVQGVEGEGTLLLLEQIPFDALGWRVEILQTDGTVTVPSTGSRALPQASQLRQNYPNPFNPATTIPFAVGGYLPAKVRLDIYDLLGQRIRTVVDDVLGAGPHLAHWDGRDDRGGEVASGIYLYSLRVIPALSRGGEATGTTAELTRRLLLIR